LPTVAALGVNLTLAAARGELEPVVARDVEIEQTLDVLAKRSGNCPCLVGSPGVGKTSVAHGLALRVASERPRSKLDDRVLVELPAAKLLSGTAARGSLAERMGALCREVREAEGRVVLFVDDLHQLLASDGAGEVGAELKSAVSRGDVPLVAATTPEEYRRLVESDPALCRCFTPIEIEEPDRERAVLMLLCARGSLARHHGVSIGDDAVEACVAWSVRYLPGRALPDKALAVLDFACARARRRQSSALHLDTIADVVAEMADVPAERLLETDRDRMLALESLLADRVVGHRQALERIAVILRRNAAGIRGRRPIGSFLLLGPTGVGKTETAKAIAEALFHSSDAMTRLDLSEFAEPHSLARLVGSPPGYVGHEAGGQLTEAVRRRPYQVLLLDEVEKAHRDVLQAFLQVLDEGRMTDGRGRTVDFTSTVVVMTSNLGSAEAAQAERAQGIGFARRADRGGADGSEAFVRAARQALAPELYNRIDEVLPYAPLGRAEVREIARRLLAALGRQLEQTRGASLAFDDDVVELLLERGGFDPALGARPMRRTIARLVEAPIADIVLRRQLGEGSALRLKRCRDGTVEVRVAASDC
jgi:ATP-dependent Clp protease ATP-binding subunit ClpC